MLPLCCLAAAMDDRVVGHEIRRASNSSSFSPSRCRSSEQADGLLPVEAQHAHPDGTIAFLARLLRSLTTCTMGVLGLHSWQRLEGGLPFGLRPNKSLQSSTVDSTLLDTSCIFFAPILSRFYFKPVGAATREHRAQSHGEVLTLFVGDMNLARPCQAA